MSIRIALVDDHTQFRNYLAEALSRRPGIAVVMQADDGVAAAEALKAMAPADRPQVLLMDVDMPRGGGIKATREILRQYPNLRVVALSMHDDPHLLEAMLSAGASAYVRKGEPLQVLLAAIRGTAI